jgi:radical SAM superfamily enzyme YgiQ (UPF0313 family)
MKVLFVYPAFERHAASNPELLDFVPMNEYLGSPSLGIASLAACTPREWEIEYRDDRISDAQHPTDADLVALSFFTPAAKRGMELADYFRALGKQVIAGGIFPSMMPDVVAPHVDAVVVGEGEGVWLQVLADAASKRLLPRYKSGPVDLATVPLPRVDLYFGTGADDYPLQVSRGCGMSCSACAIPGVMDTHIRTFSLDHVVGQLAQLTAAGVKGCLTEDTGWFPGAARRRMMELFDAVAASGSTAAISYAGISMPMILSTSTEFLNRAKAAGVDMFYLVGGFDPITTRAFTGKDPKALERAETCIAKCHDTGIEPYTSFLIGLDDDDEGTVDRMLDFADRSKIRKAEFAVFTPYPGTPSWKRLLAEDRILHRDWSKYNDANVVFQPAKMSPDALHAAYLRLWREFYRGRGHLADLPLFERTIQF